MFYHQSQQSGGLGPIYHKSHCRDVLDLWPHLLRILMEMIELHLLGLSQCFITKASSREASDLTPSWPLCWAYLTMASRNGLFATTLLNTSAATLQEQNNSQKKDKCRSKHQVHYVIKGKLGEADT